MDFSSLPETQQQQQSYCPAQVYADEAYYGYHPQHYDPSTSHHQYYYPYEYAATYHQQQHPAAASQDASSTPAVHPGPSQASQHQGTAAPGVPGYAVDSQGSYPVPPGLNPVAAAAVAALSQLSEIAGTMDAAERAMAGMQGRQWHAKIAPGTIGQMAASPHHPHQYPTHYPGARRGAGVRAPNDVGGRRGGGPFRGGHNAGRANLGHYLQGADGGAPFSQGRGRGAHMGRGGGRQFHQSAKTSTREPESAETQVSGLALVPPRKACLPLAWCDICRVDCNSLQILEQHKNGKRHKRTVQRFEEIQAQQRLLAETQAQTSMQGSDRIVTQSQLMAESQEASRDCHPETVIQAAEENMIVQVSEDLKASVVLENAQEASACEKTMKINLQDQVVDEETEGIIYLPLAEGPTRDRPPKRRMMRFSRGDKRFRYFRPIESRPKERPKEQPRICTLCNAVCETKVVFDSHIAGKKHISRIKRFQGKAVYGPVDIYIAPNQPTIYNPPGLQPLFFGLKTQEMVHLVAPEPSSLMETYGPHQPEQGEPVVPVLQMEQVGRTQSQEGLGTQDQAVVTVEGGQSTVTAHEMQDALATQSEQPGSTVSEVDSVFMSVKDVVDSETLMTAVDIVDAGPGSMATEPIVTTTKYVATKADVAVTTTGNVAAEVEATCRLIKQVPAEYETASEIEVAVESDTPLECKGDQGLGS